MIPIPSDVSERTPLMKNEWMASIEKMRERNDAPKWNVKVGDRLSGAELSRLRVFSGRLAGGLRAFDHCGWALSMALRSAWVAEAIGDRNVFSEWGNIPVMDRTVIRERLHDVIPADESLEGLIVNPTSGTTGMPVKVPASPFSQGAYDPLIDLALSRNGVALASGPGTIAAVQLCFQKRTIVYHCVHSYRGGAGFAKVNLDEAAWKSPGDPASWLVAMAADLISGDPVAFARFLDMDVPLKPKAFLSTSMRLAQGLRDELETRYGCPVVDWYSTNETGPIASTITGSGGLFRVLPDDIFVEIADDSGVPVPRGKEGRILVTGGRNPYVPLLRYDTGDSGRIEERDGMEYIALADTRKPFLFALPGGRIVNPVDIAGIMRRFPVRLHRCVLCLDGSMKVSVEGAGARLWMPGLKPELEALFGTGTRLVLEEGIPLSVGKVEPYTLER